MRKIRTSSINERLVLVSNLTNVLKIRYRRTRKVNCECVVKVTHFSFSGARGSSLGVSSVFFPDVLRRFFFLFSSFFSPHNNNNHRFFRPWRVFLHNDGWICYRRHCFGAFHCALRDCVFKNLSRSYSILWVKNAAVFSRFSGGRAGAASGGAASEVRGMCK